MSLLTRLSWILQNHTMLYKHDEATFYQIANSLSETREQSTNTWLQSELSFESENSNSMVPF